MAPNIERRSRLPGEWARIVRSRRRAGSLPLAVAVRERFDPALSALGVPSWPAGESAELDTRIALNKSSLKRERDQLGLYERYLPSLDLKRQQLLAAQKKARGELAERERAFAAANASAESWTSLLIDGGFEPGGLVEVEAVEIGEENAMGTRLPLLRELRFSQREYSILFTPHWADQAVASLRAITEESVRVAIARRRLRLLDAAVKQITQRVNLFEKVLIPTARANIQKIRVWLSDLERMAVCRAKIAKGRQAAEDRTAAEEPGFEEEEAPA
jgi:V/A-type H+-transporting ATPase subunit D